ncbi:TonB-dependent receptor domain-containing protein, partial [Pseudomonas viridiflava]|uniref:TonB-dependent receptor domain-containing protein n=1 Tax=Pseudomonas viridiflava TaxID=33069 RepID=UPI000F0202AF
FTPADKPLNDSHRALDSRQYGVFITDRMRLSEHWQTILGGREVRLDKRAFDSDGNPSRHTQQYVFLPQAALIYKPVEAVSLYTSYSKGLSLGGTAPWFASNPDTTLAP